MPYNSMLLFLFFCQVHEEIKFLQKEIGLNANALAEYTGEDLGSCFVPW